jgi:hypothetical protein
MKKCHYKALERIFTAEIEGCLPLQSKAAVFPELATMGLAQHGEEKWGNVSVKGWYLTQAGRLAYCMEC